MNKPDPVDYVDNLPDRIMQAAGEYTVISMQIDKRYIPLMASDIIRGQSLRMAELPEDGIHTYLMKEKENSDVVAINIPAQMAQMLAMDLKAGQQVRKRHH